jgi:hypothetical protein
VPQQRPLRRRCDHPSDLLGVVTQFGRQVAVEPQGGKAVHDRPRRDARGRQNLGWAIGYNAIALPIAAGVFEPAFGLVLRPEIAALSMSGSSFIVAVNAVMLKRLHLPADPAEQSPAEQAHISLSR